MGRKAAGQRCVLEHGADLAVTIFRSKSSCCALYFRLAMTAKRRCTKVLRAEPTKHYGNSEAGLAHAGDLALISQLTEADTADAVVAQVSVGAAADLAAVVLAGGELSRSLLFQNHRFLSHILSPP